MRVGFTGTRDGTTCEQHRELCLLVQTLAVAEFHHGCCVGADSEAFDVVQTFAKAARTVAHPPDKRGMACRHAEEFSDERRAPLPFLDRNRAIVDATEVLIACPKEMAEERRSGTWATVRHARKQGKRIVIVWPDGTVTEGAFNMAKPKRGTVTITCGGHRLVVTIGANDRRYFDCASMPDLAARFDGAADPDEVKAALDEFDRRAAAASAEKLKESA